MYLYNDGEEITGALDDSIVEKKMPILEKMPQIAELDYMAKDLSFESKSRSDYVFESIPLAGWHLAMQRDYTFNDFIVNGSTALIAESSATMKTSMDEMSIGARRISESGTELSEISEKMKDSITDMGEQIDQFTV